MNVLLHHLKTEYKLNAKALWFNTAFLQLFAWVFSQKNDGAIDIIPIITYSFFSGVLIGSSQKRDFSLKYYFSLPVQREQVILLLILGRILFFIPGLITLLFIYDKIPQHDILNYSLPSAFLCYLVFVSIFNASQVINDIEILRHDTFTSRLESLLVTFKKLFIGYGFKGTLAFAGFMILQSLVKALGLDFLNNQYLLILYGGSILYLMIRRCYKVLLNEHLSYWYWKKDGVLVGCVLVLMFAPGLIYKEKITSFSFFKEKSPYFQVIKDKEYAKIKELYEQGQDPLQKSIFGYTPAEYAIRSGTVEALKELEAIGAGIDTKAKFKANVFSQEEEKPEFSAAHLAVFSGSVEMLEYLLQKPEMANALNKEKFKNSLLVAAASNCQPEIINTLVHKYGDDVNQRHKDYSTPIMIAMKNNCLSAAIELVLNGANLEYKDEQGKTVFDYTQSASAAYILQRLNPKKVIKDRAPASTNLDFPSPRR